MFFGEHGSILTCTVKLDFKNHQDKNQLGFKNQNANYQVDKISFKDRQDKNNLTLRTKMAVTKNVLKVKFDVFLLESLSISNNDDDSMSQHNFSTL